MAVLERARANHIPAILDADIGPDPVPRELVELASHAIFSLPGLAQFADTSDIEAGLHKAREASEAAVGVTQVPEDFTGSTLKVAKPATFRHWMSKPSIRWMPATCLTAPLLLLSAKRNPWKTQPGLPMLPRA
jgi:hypothetical protein